MFRADTLSLLEKGQRNFQDSCNFSLCYLSIYVTVEKLIIEDAMKTLSKLIIGFSFGLPVLFLLLSTVSSADTMSKTNTSEKVEVATLAGGCFWCTESDLEQLTGVLDVVSGYSGGHVKNPTYKQVSSGKSGHIEVVEVKYDPSVVSYEQVLDYFFRHIDPTDDKGSFVDRGPQYRPAIFITMRSKSRLLKTS